MPRKRRKPKPKPPTLEERQQAIISGLQNDPRLSAERAKLRRLADHPVMREMREAAERGRKVAEIERQRRERRARSPAPARKRERGAPTKLTQAEIERGIEIVRRAEVAYHKKYPKGWLKQADAIEALKRNLKRNGKPIEVGRMTWVRHVIWPALG